MIILMGAEVSFPQPDHHLCFQHDDHLYLQHVLHNGHPLQVIHLLIGLLPNDQKSNQTYWLANEIVIEIAIDLEEAIEINLETKIGLIMKIQGHLLIDNGPINSLFQQLSEAI